MKKKGLLRKMGVVLLSLVLFSGTLAGCGQTTPAGTTPSPIASSPGESTPAAESSAPASPAAVDPSTVKDTITVYTALEDDIIEQYLVSFKEKYPNITVEIVRDSTGTIISKLIAEKEAPVADILWGTAVTSLLALDEYGLIEPYNPEGIDRILPQFKDKESTARWVGIDVPETAILVNKSECDRLGVPVPASYADLIKPEYKGLIAMSDPTSSGTGLFIINSILQIMGDEAGWAYLDAFDKNVIEYTPSGSKPAKMAAAGEAVIGLSMGYRCVTLALENKECVVVFPKEGSGWDVEANCLIKKDTIKDAAKIFCDWAISDEAMAAYQVEYPIICTGGDGSTPEGYNQNPVLNLYSGIDLYKMAEGRTTFFEEFTKRYLSVRQ